MTRIPNFTSRFTFTFTLHLPELPCLKLLLLLLFLLLVLLLLLLLLLVLLFTSSHMIFVL